MDRLIQSVRGLRAQLGGLGRRPSHVDLPRRSIPIYSQAQNELMVDR